LAISAAPSSAALRSGRHCRAKPFDLDAFIGEKTERAGRVEQRAIMLASSAYSGASGLGLVKNRWSPLCRLHFPSLCGGRSYLE
jgi:hypothetical protein